MHTMTGSNTFVLTEKELKLQEVKLRMLEILIEKV